MTFEAHITNSEDGVHWVIKAPLGLVQTSTWRIVKSSEVGKGKGKADNVDDGEEGEGEVEGAGETAKKEKEEWTLVEDVEIRASRLLVGTVKSKCEQQWQGIHARFMGKLTEQKVES